MPPAAKPAADGDRLLGTLIGNYRLTRLLGAGGFARVYLAEHTVIGSKVAIKILHEDFADDPDVTQRFVGEARATNSVQHENIVQITDINILGVNQYFIVMEYLDGRTLEEACGGKVTPFAAMADILSQTCAGLDAAHRAGVIHRDLKPENIYLVDQGGRTQVKIADFGIAHREELDAGENRTTIGTVLGTPAYISPEQTFGLPVDGRSDIYSLGVIMFRLATGRFPFWSENVSELLHFHQAMPPPDPRTIQPTIDPRFSALILRALAKRPADRFATMGELGQAIAALQRPAQSAEPSGEIRELLQRARAAPEGDFYALLGVLPHADFGTIRGACKKLDALLGEAMASGPPAHRRTLAALRQRLAIAEDTLVDPLRRAAHDAQNGNFAGVARCLAAGLDAGALDALRQRFLDATPNLQALVRPILQRADECDSRGDWRASVDALTVALKIDPLDLTLQKRYWDTRRKARA